MELVSRFFNPPDSSFFLFGPRGTGKSTLVRQQFPRALYLDLLEPETYRGFSAAPERLRQVLLGSPETTTVVIDEIQKLPQLLDLVHSLIEERRGWRFVLTGSSSRKLKRAGIDLLAGRALLCTLHPFMAAELGNRFDLDDALRIGMLPIVLDSPDPTRVLRSYAALYLREEVQFEGLVRKIGNFSRFLEAISFSHASVLNVSNVARECQVKRKTVDAYIGILEDLLLAYRLDVFSRRAQRALISHPKFYFFDAGVFRSLRPQGPLDRPEEIGGHALEGLVGQHLRAWIAYSPEEWSLHYWRTRAGVEVDFVLCGPDRILAIEVKNSAQIHPRDLGPLRAFMQDYPESQAYLLYRGKDRLLNGGVLCLPCGEFLRELTPGRWLDA
ncbi:MAG: ATP-binding protein [Candidatus Eisenbacteria sp.]|nr:ATP-binding protein [Candidatus Eisenbacteria bacterium]